MKLNVNSINTMQKRLGEVQKFDSYLNVNTCCIYTLEFCYALLFMKNHFEQPAEY